MNDSLRVCYVQSLCDLRDNPDPVLQIHRFRVDVLLQAFSLKEFHYDEGPSSMLTDVVDCADVGMIESRCSTCFALEALSCPHIVKVFFWEEF